jgi:hypothetical protein
LLDQAGEVMGDAPGNAALAAQDELIETGPAVLG